MAQLSADSPSLSTAEVCRAAVPRARGLLPLLRWPPASAASAQLGSRSCCLFPLVTATIRGVWAWFALEYTALLISLHQLGMENRSVSCWLQTDTGETTRALSSPSHGLCVACLRCLKNAGLLVQRCDWPRESEFFNS